METHQSNMPNEILHNKEWIPISNRLPELRKDFETMCEVQYISSPVFILSNVSAEWKDNLTGELLKEPVEVKAYYVERQRMGKFFSGWSLSATATAAYFELGIATHWRKML